ncbi:hypothetical protein E9M_01786 [Moraxella catarrhalis 46P47B1]|nr:hypothetical protein E9M_01786 [Moraxella catarrhalis 46P47B1]
MVMKCDHIKPKAYHYASIFCDLGGFDDDKF